MPSLTLSSLSDLGKHCPCPSTVVAPWYSDSSFKSSFYASLYMNSLDVGFISEFEILSSDQRRCRELYFTSHTSLEEKGKVLSTLSGYLPYLSSKYLTFTYLNQPHPITINRQ